MYLMCGSYFVNVVFLDHCSSATASFLASCSLFKLVNSIHDELKILTVN